MLRELQAVVALVDGGRPDAAESELRRILGRSESAPARDMLARLLLRQGRTDEALEVGDPLAQDIDGVVVANAGIGLNKRIEKRRSVESGTVHRSKSRIGSWWKRS